MRNARPGSWQNILFVVPALVAAAGITYMVKKHKTTSPSSDEAPVATSEKTSGYRTIASKINSMNEDEDTPQQDLSAIKHKAVSSIPAVKSQHSQASDHASSGKTADGKEICTSFELRGDGTAATHVTNPEWTQVLEVFHQSKTDLQGWLTQHKKEVSPELVAWMSKQIEEAKIQRPPALEEPDLAWRGIGYVSHTTNGGEATPWVRIGGGFVKMVVTQPARARFELTRLLAQSWNPCDMPTGAQGTWTPLLQCVGMKEQEWDVKKTCTASSESEAGWAVASSIAYVVSPPGCVVPAFQNAAISNCITKTAWLTTDTRKPASVTEATTPSGAPVMAPVAKPAAVDNSGGGSVIEVKFRETETKVSKDQK